MAEKYLDTNGLSRLWNKISNKFLSLAGGTLTGALTILNNDGSASMQLGENSAALGIYSSQLNNWIVKTNGTSVFIPKWANKGSATKPVYFDNDGHPAACEDSLAVDITGHAASAGQLSSDTVTILGGFAATPLLLACENNKAVWSLERTSSTEKSLAAHYYNEEGSWIAEGVLLDNINYTTYVNPASIGALPISGGTMTGQIKLASNGYRTFSDNGYSVDQYGNFTHLSNSTSDYWMIKASDGSTPAIQVYSETGDVSVKNNLTAFRYIGGSMELNPGANTNHGGFIDFHYNNSTEDYTSRIIESSSGILDLNAEANKKVRLGAVANDLTISNPNNYSYLFLANSSGTRIGGLYASSSEGKLYIINHSPNSPSQKYEGYGMPTPTEGLTENKWYKVLTSKETVTIAQGGTGATTAAAARKALGALSASWDASTGTLTLTA